MTDPITHANTLAEIDDLKARVASVERERDEAMARHRHLSERHFTCNGCGGSWNCEPLAERDNHGCRVPRRPCPYCQYERECAGVMSRIQQVVTLQKDVKRLQKNVEQWRQYALDCGGHMCASIGCGKPGLAQAEEGLWFCPRCAKKNGYEKESCL